MPGTTTTPPADGTTGDATTQGQGQEGQGAAGAAGAGAPAGGTEKTFTQAELDAIIAARLAREKPDPEVLRKAQEYDKLQEAQQTELEKANTRAERAEAKAKEAETKAQGILIRAAIMTEAAAQNAADADTVIALLAGNATITVEGDEVKGVKEAVKALLKDKPFLVKATTPGTSGGEFGGNDQKTLQEKIREAESKGDWKTARQLKLQGLPR